MIFFPPAKAQVDVSVSLKPFPPENVQVIHQTPTQVELTWDASPSLPVNVDHYSIFYKLKSEGTYPSTPQITRFDSLSHYSELIAVEANVGYDFKVFANAPSGIKSSENCSSCQATNANCGNSIIEPGETCDDENLEALVCTDFGYVSGALACSPSCQMDFSACISSPPPVDPDSVVVPAPSVGVGNGGGGGGGVILLPPHSGRATSPKSTNLSTINVSYSGASAVYPKKLTQVHLYYKKDEGNWIDSGLKQSESSGQFQFQVEPDYEAAVYYFALQAYDNFGVSSASPSGLGDTSTLYAPKPATDNQAPTVDSIFLSLSADGSLILVSYRNAKDLGTSGLKQVELWYKKGEEGFWTFSGSMSSKSSDLFPFDPSSLNGTYYFALVLQDHAGNRSQPPSGDGQGNVVFNVEPFQAVLNAPKEPLISSDSITIAMGGKGIVAYKYKLNDDSYSQAISVQQDLVLSELKKGEYVLSVLGKNEQGVWQDVSSPTLYRFVVDFSQPKITVSGPEPLQTITQNTFPKQVVYTLSYSDFSQVTLKLEDVHLIKTGTANALLVLTRLKEDLWQVTLKNISGLGTLHIAVSANTARHANGRGAPAVEMSVLSMVNIDSPKPDEILQNSPPSSELTEVSLPIPPDVSVYPSLLDEEDKIDFDSIFSGDIVAPEPEIHYTFSQIAEKSREVLAFSQVLLSPARRFEFLSTQAWGVDQLAFCSQQYRRVDFDTPGLDQDHDGLSNRMECYVATDPNQADTDGDSCSDGEELNQLSTDPLDKSDCPINTPLKTLFITNPHPGWTVSDLRITGITPQNTSEVYLTAFPVLQGQALKDKPIELGHTNQFHFSSLIPHYFFEINSETHLVDAQAYDLVAVGIMEEGTILYSDPLRFYFDSGLKLKPPELIALNRTPINILTLNDLNVIATQDGHIQLRGKAEYGSRVFAVWQSLTMVSSVVVDSPSGEFMIQSPEPLNLKQKHQVTLYAVKEGGDGQIFRSKSVDFEFSLSEGLFLPDKAVFIVITLLATLILLQAFYLKRARRN